MTTKIEGTWPALITPFKDGAVDEAKIRDLTKWQIKNGVSGIIACGTTGEAPTLDTEEHSCVVRTIVEAADGKVPVFAGVGTNNTKHVIENAKRVEKLGVEGLLVVNPYYNKPTQSGLYAHFRAVSEATPLDIIVYNIQGRTAVNVETPTLVRLANDCKNIVGVKEASGSLDQMSQVARSCPKGFAMMSGDDALTLPCMAVGGKGVIATTANIVPKEMSDMTSAALAGNWDKARELHFRLYPLFKALFIESNPQPLKEAMAMMKLIDAPELRLPMVRMEEANRLRLAAVMKEYGLI
ncbi:MAG: 4-hydroxy-tetrahydrodipicolinate synthase [Alphaproteobacteria bacterium]|nr:4-hydroxy-tetrahydrodipicolinate synthase [Alphaproteobacteria bacterium]